jgi:hypothetical protein
MNLAVHRLRGEIKKAGAYYNASLHRGGRGCIHTHTWQQVQHARVCGHQEDQMAVIDCTFNVGVGAVGGAFFGLVYLLGGLKG